MYIFLCFFFSDMSRISCSQPEYNQHGYNGETNHATPEESEHIFSFSQPVHPDHMLLSSQFQGTPGSSQVITCSIYSNSELIMDFLTSREIKFNSFDIEAYHDNKTESYFSRFEKLLNH